MSLPAKGEIKEKIQLSKEMIHSSLKRMKEAGTPRFRDGKDAGKPTRVSE